MVYRVVKFEMVDGKKFFVYEELSGVKEVRTHGTTKFIDESSGRDVRPMWPSWVTLTSDLSQYKPGTLFNGKETEYLPYVADVIEDLPSSVKGKFPPREYPSCKLLAQKCNGYMEFFHEPTGKTLRIAMNSNYYKPSA